MMQPAPMVAPSRTSVGRVCSSGSLGRKVFKSGKVARGKRSLVKVVASGNHHAVFDRHGGADVNHRVDLHRLPIFTSYAI